MRMEEAELVQHILEKEEIVLPTVILCQKMILELEEALRKEKLLYVSKFFKKVYENFDEYINIEGVDKLFELIEKTSKEINSQYQVSKDDKKIIEFLVNKTKIKNIDVLEIVGQQYFTFQVAKELEKNIDNLSNILKITLFMWCFVNTYELVLHNVDRRLLFYLENYKTKDRNIKRFLKIKRDEYKDHATVDLINKVFCTLLRIKEENNSIFGKTSKPRLIRNKISHSNIFYDSGKNKIILLGGQEYDIKDFLEEYYKIFNFLVTWINEALGDGFNKEDVISDMKDYFKVLSSEFLKYERRGLNKDYSTYIINLKKEAGV